MMKRHDRWVAANFGSATSEAAVCLRTVGIADRFDRTTLELRGSPEDVDLALMGLSRQETRSWWARPTSRNAIVRCERGDRAACLDALTPAEGIVAVDLSNRTAAIGVIGPRAAQLLGACNFKAHGTPPIVLREAETVFEIIVPAAQGPALWKKLLATGVQFQVACVGLDALARLDASRRLNDSGSQARVVPPVAAEIPWRGPRSTITPQAEST
jgi:hypothetical protein